MSRFRNALVRGRRADHWEHDEGYLVLRHPRGTDSTEIPLEHLQNDAAMEDHYRRLALKEWVSPAALAELREIVAGARP